MVGWLGGMGALELYLITLNLLTLILAGLAHRRGLGPSLSLSSSALSVLALAGGAVGAVLSWVLFGGPTRKENVAGRFVSVFALLLWALLLAQLKGPCPFEIERFSQSLSRDHTPLLIYLAAINLVAFVLFCVDKGRARRGAWRVAEHVLLGLVLAGGGLGALLAMLLTHHKVRTPYFAVGVPATLVLTTLIIAYHMQAGLV